MSAKWNPMCQKDFDGRRRRRRRGLNDVHPENSGEAARTTGRSARNDVAQYPRYRSSSGSRTTLFL